MTQPDYESAARAFMSRWPDGSVGTRALLAELDAVRARVAELETENERLREAVLSSPEMARLLAAIDAGPPARPAEDPTTEE